MLLNPAGGLLKHIFVKRLHGIHVKSDNIIYNKINL